jgi:cephalosporin hydroxylase
MHAIQMLHIYIGARPRADVLFDKVQDCANKEIAEQARNKENSKGSCPVMVILNGWHFHKKCLFTVGMFNESIKNGIHIKSFDKWS